jgi:outer membrane protein OmpA-like peptidoglycan-associated protein
LPQVQQVPAGPPTANRPAGPLPGVAAVPQANPQDWRNRSINDVRGQRQQTNQNGRLIIQEPGRTIVQENGRSFVRHNEFDRFRLDSRGMRTERQGNHNVTVIDRGGGVQIVTINDDQGRLLRRFRRDPDGREIVIIDNTRFAPTELDNYYVVLPPPRITIPRERYIVEAEDAPPDVIYDTLMAPPVEQLDRAYTLDEVRFSQELRARMPRIDLDSITFETGSWEVTPDQVQRLAPIAEGMRRAIARNPAEVFMVEGHTDAVGNDIDNLSLSDRRAEAVAEVLTESFQIPPENLVTQGYGEQYLKVPTQGPSRENRRVTVRRITPLIAQNQ